MSEVGNFQQSVGELSGSVGLVTAYIGAAVLVVCAVVLAIFACIPFQSSKGPKKTRLQLLFVSFALLLIALISVMYHKWYNSFVHESRGNAEVGAALTEFRMASRMLRRE